MTDERMLVSPSGLTSLPEGAISLGSEDHWFVKMVDSVNAWVGITEFHKEHKDDSWEWSGGYVPFDVPDQKWTGDRWVVNSLDPLDLSPSLQCKTCPNHGYIRQGKWVDS